MQHVRHFRSETTGFMVKIRLGTPNTAEPAINTLNVVRYCSQTFAYGLTDAVR